jgi:hypothetical protein
MLSVTRQILMGTNILEKIMCTRIIRITFFLLFSYVCIFTEFVVLYWSNRFGVKHSVVSYTSNTVNLECEIQYCIAYEWDLISQVNCVSIYVLRNR